MARTHDYDRLKHAWDHLSNGGNYKDSGVHPLHVPLIKRIISEGWTWDVFAYRVISEGVALQALVDEIDGKPVRKTGRPPRDPSTHEPKPKPERVEPERREPQPKPARMEIIQPEGAVSQYTGRTPQKRETWQERQANRILSQREHRELELATSRKRLQWYDKAWDSIEPFLRTKVSRSKKEGPCSHCGKPTVIEMVDIHPVKANIGDLIKGEREAMDRIRLALHMPKQMTAVRLQDGGGLAHEHLERINEAFKAAFTDGIKQGLISQETATQIWEFARRMIDGQQEQH